MAARVQRCPRAEDTGAARGHDADWMGAATAACYGQLGLVGVGPGPAVLRALDAQLTRESELERRALTCRSLNPGEQAAQSG